MSRLFASWRALRWLAFLFSLALDAYIFHISDPFTPRQALVGIGNVELRETAGGEGEVLIDVWKPRLLEKKIRTAIKVSRRHGD